MAVVKLKTVEATSATFSVKAEVASAATGGPRAAAAVLMRSLAAEYPDDAAWFNSAAGAVSASFPPGGAEREIPQAWIDAAVAEKKKGASNYRASDRVAENVSDPNLPNDRRNIRDCLIRRLEKL
jgi:hypothetical protein